ncbi:MAG: alpha/beta hydrolase, partial [Bacteroidales bacterium]|nr:alpha/beta hydrolase [Bacteroidales bacterium]
YANLEWTIFLKPESSINILIPETSLESIEYTGQLISSNTYLLKTGSLSEDLNVFFNKNWLQFHRQNQADYISTIDSLKGLYLKHLSADSKRYETFSQEFIKTWKAEIDFGLNTLILRYPERHFQLTNNTVELSRNAIDYLKSSEIDNLEYFDLSGYKSYTKAWIDYKSEILIEKDTSLKHYSLKKMETILQIVPEIFNNQYLRDFWLTEYLKENIDKNGIANSYQYINQFNAICKTEVFKNEIEQNIKSVLDARKDHEVKIYKTENAFHLEVHIFKPEDMTSTEKRPTIVIFHGGGWNGGNPSWAFGRAQHFKDLGMVAIAAQYRLTNEHDITALESMSDARDLIIWIRSKSDSLNISPDSIVAYGWSAGAHLVSSAAIFSDSIPNQNINSIPNAMILVSPAVSLPKGKGWEVWKQNVFGAKTTVSSANPVEHVRKGLPPTIILQGRDDSVTPLDGVQLFHDKMLANGNYCELWIYDGVGHLFTPNTMPDYREPHPDKEIQKKAYNKADEFLKKIGYIKD